MNPSLGQIKSAPTLEQIYAPIQKYLPQVEEEILNILSGANQLSSEVIRYFFKAKGKFLRPALCLLAASNGKGINRTVIRTAGALEIFHSATLIHDDIIDASYLRRNMPTIQAAWGPQVAVLVGDYLHDQAIGTIFQSKNDAAIQAFLETAGIVCDGEILELSQKGNFDLTEDEYITIIDRKTASLLSCCLVAGANLAGLSEPQIKALGKYGTCFGIAFQIIDDLLDYTGHENEFGKTLGADCAAGVLTLPVIRLLSSCDMNAKSRIIELVKSGNNSGGYKELVQLLRNSDAFDYTLQRAKDFVDLGRAELKALAGHSAAASLGLLLSYILERHR